MADYKEFLGSLVNRAKSAVESSGIKEVYQQGADRTKSYAKIARLSLDVNNRADELRKVYTEIGKLYFEQRRDKPEGFFAPLFAQAETLLAEIASKDAEITATKDALRSAKPEKDIEVEITQEIDDFAAVVDAAENEGKGGGE
jgi:hypothetical protein